MLDKIYQGINDDIEINSYLFSKIISKESLSKEILLNTNSAIIVATRKERDEYNFYCLKKFDPDFKM